MVAPHHSPKVAPHMAQMRPGDVALFRPVNTVGRIIAAVTMSPYCHVRMIVSEDGDTVEADFKGVIRGHVEPGDVVTSPPLTDAQRAAIPAAAAGLVGTPYGFADIIILGLSRLGIRIPWLSRHVLARPTHLFCSQLVDEVWQAVGYRAFDDGRLPSDVTPGDIADHAFTNDWATQPIPAN